MTEKKEIQYASILEMTKELFSEYAMITRSMLDYYDQIGLIKSEFTISSTRVFKREETIKRIKEIIKLKEQGFSLTEIKNQLDK